MKLTQQILFVMIILAIITAIARIGVSTLLVTGGIDLNDLQSQTIALQKENTLLKEQIYEQSSLLAIKERAEKVGFTNENSHLVLTAPVPVAYKQ